MDVHQAERTVELLDSFIFSEDVEVTSAVESFHHLEIHGPRGPELLNTLTDNGMPKLEPFRAVSLMLGTDSEIFVARSDQTGETGLILLVPRSKVTDVWRTLVQADEKLAEGKKRRVVLHHAQS